MPPSIISVEINPLVLSADESDVIVRATVTDDGGVTRVFAGAWDPTITDVYETEMTLVSGDNLNGTWTGTIVIPFGISGGLFQIAVLATNADTVEEDYSTYGYNDESVITVIRPGEPGESGEKEECCCKVSINVTAGPVNIYVCGSEKKSNIPV